MYAIRSYYALTARRARRPGLDLTETVGTAELELRDQLANTRIPGLSFQDEESLTTVIDGVRTISGLPIVVDPLADDVV